MRVRYPPVASYRESKPLLIWVTPTLVDCAPCSVIMTVEYSSPSVSSLTGHCLAQHSSNVRPSSAETGASTA